MLRKSFPIAQSGVQFKKYKKKHNITEQETKTIWNASRKDYFVTARKDGNIQCKYQMMNKDILTVLKKRETRNSKIKRNRSYVEKGLSARNLSQRDLK